MIRIFILFLFAPVLAHADEWTRADTTMQILYSGVHIADWNQTLQIIKSDKYEESNIILGRHPSEDQANLYFITTLAGHYYIARKLDQPFRFLWQMVWINRQYSAMNHNRKIGLHVNFKF